MLLWETDDPGGPELNKQRKIDGCVSNFDSFSRFLLPLSQHFCHVLCVEGRIGPRKDLNIKKPLSFIAGTR